MKVNALPILYYLPAIRRGFLPQRLRHLQKGSSKGEDVRSHPSLGSKRTFAARLLPEAECETQRVLLMAEARQKVFTRQRHGYYLAEVMGVRIYCNRENWRILKELGIRLVSKQLGRPSEKDMVDYDPRDQNPIEGKFGQGKVRFGMDRIKTWLKYTSESCVAMKLLVMNGVSLAKEAFYYWLRPILSFMAKIFQKIIGEKKMGGQPAYLSHKCRYKIFQ
jgi:hypothetical protein